MVIITRRKRLLKQDTPPRMTQMVACQRIHAGSYIIDYRLIQTCTLTNFKHVYY